MSALRERALAEAMSWIGTPYQHQASLIGVGADCLGLIRGLWRELIGPEPEPMRPYSPDWAEASGEESLIALGDSYFIAAAGEAWAPGDVLVFRFRDGAPAKHVGVATAVDRMIHAHDGARVAEVAIVPFWRRRIVRAFSFPGLAQGSR